MLTRCSVRSAAPVTGTIQEREPMPKQPSSRICLHCDWKPGRLKEGQSELEQHAEHLATHNPTPTAWATAHNTIQDAKDRKPKESTQPA